MKFFSPQDCLAIWKANKPTRCGKTLWASIYKCIECAVEQDEIVRTLSDIKTDIAKHDLEIRTDEIRKFAEWCKIKGYSCYDWRMLIEEYENEKEQKNVNGR